MVNAVVHWQRLEVPGLDGSCSEPADINWGDEIGGFPHRFQRREGQEEGVAHVLKGGLLPQKVVKGFAGVLMWVPWQNLQITSCWEQ